ncbi:Rnf-Nqr domain containing protein [Povalibacter sp.]|uniref:Rnf-Nqr domain containing protein n=1 Tax=Povalibacter sp. TaxID=1962978 RepID=UPI002F3F8AB2
MSSLLLILLAAVLVSQYAPAMLGTRLFEATDDYSNSVGLALASFILIAAVAIIAYGIDHAVLRPFAIDYLRTFVVIIVIMTLAPVVAASMSKLGSWTPVHWPLVLVLIGNPAVLGTALQSAVAPDFSTALWLGIGIGAAFAALLLAFATLQARVATARVPRAFREMPVAFVTVGLMALALMGLTGLVRD